MDRNNLRIAGEIAAQAIKEAFAKHPNLKDVEVSRAGGTYGEMISMLKIRLVEKNITVPATDQFGQNVSDGSVKSGLAKAGTRIQFQDRGRMRRGVIIDVKRVKYVYRDDSDGRDYLIRFMACSLETPVKVG